MKSTLLLAAQAIFAIFGLRQLARNVLPELPRMRHSQLILDIWAPLAVVGPMLFLIGRSSNSVSGPGWLAVGGPLLCAIFGVGLALARAGALRRVDVLEDSSISLCGAGVAAAGAGLLILLLGAAHDMTIWVGQCAFAIGAVLLWINTPSDAEDSQHGAMAHASEKRAGLGMAAMVSCSLVQGHVVMNMRGPLTMVSEIMVFMYAVLALAFIAKIAGPQVCARVGLWGAALGVFFGLGLISLSSMIPEALRILRFGHGQPLNKIASGFGMLAPEAAGVIVVAGLAIALPRMRSGSALTLGVRVVGAALNASVTRWLMLWA
jgi:hypothetical protein